MSQSANMPSQEVQLPGPPYPATTAALGGRPSIGLDVPLSSVFLVLYILGAATHMFIFQRNRKLGHKFIMSAMTFGFCMSRILTMVLRICWAVYDTNVSLGIAATIFVQAGVLLLFVINLLFAQRVVRAAHPTFGWSMAFSWFFRVIYILIPAVLVMVIVTVVMSFYTLDVRTKLTEHDIQLGCQTFLLFVAFLPLPMTILVLAIPRQGPHGLEKFGTGRWRTKVTILIISSALLALGAGFRVGVNFTDARPLDNPAWYHSKTCFWIFNFVIEIIVIYSYAIVRVDLRFHIPNKSREAGGYAAAYAAQKSEPAGSAASFDDESVADKFEDRILSEEEVFDGEKPPRSSIGKDEESAPSQAA